MSVIRKIEYRDDVGRTDTKVPMSAEVTFTDSDGSKVFVSINRAGKLEIRGDRALIVRAVSSNALTVRNAAWDED